MEVVELPKWGGGNAPLAFAGYIIDPDGVQKEALLHSSPAFV